MTIEHEYHWKTKDLHDIDCTWGWIGIPRSIERILSGGEDCLFSKEKIYKTSQERHKDKGCINKNDILPK